MEWVLKFPLDWAKIVTRDAWGWNDLDLWQMKVIVSQNRYLLLNCSRQSGKSSVLAIKALWTALTVPDALILIIAEQRQSNEDIRKVKQLAKAFDTYLSDKYDGIRFQAISDNITSVEFANGSRVIALPANEKIRGFSAPTMVVMDEAGYQPDEVFVAVDPMMTVSQGQLVLASTPNGTCYSEDTDVMTELGWKNFRDVSYEDKLACLIDNHVEYHNPQNLIRAKSDTLLNFKSGQIDLKVTPNHNMWVKIQKGAWNKVPASELLGRKTDLYFRKDFPWVEGQEIETVTVPGYSWMRTLWHGGIAQIHKFETYKHPITSEQGGFSVYCATVPGGLLFVRRNGMATWCGNSGFYYTEYRNPRYEKIEVPWWDCPRIKEPEIQLKKQLYGEAYVKQEYCGEFLDDVAALFTERALRDSIDETEEVFTDQLEAFEAAFQ